MRTQLDARNYARRMSPHDHTEFIKIYVNDKNTGARKTFNLLSIHLPLVVPDQPAFGHIKLWIQKAGGEWRHWADLAPGTTWNFPQTGVGGAQGIKGNPNHLPERLGLERGWRQDRALLRRLNTVPAGSR